MNMELAENIEAEETEEELMEKEAEELRKKLEAHEQTGIGYPFDFAAVETLHGLQHQPAIEKLIVEKQNALKIILGGMEEEIERQKDMKEIYRPWGKREQNVYNMLKDLTK